MSGLGNLYFPSISPHGIALAVVPESVIPCADVPKAAVTGGGGLVAVASVPASGIQLFASLRVVRATGFCANYLAFKQLVVRCEVGLFTSTRCTHRPVFPFPPYVQTLDCTGSKHFFDAGSFASLGTLRSLNLSSCRYASREAVLTLPPCITSLGLDNCEHLEIDDAMLRGVRA